MSDELPSKTLTVERRRVERRKMLTDKGNGSYANLYVVTERQGMTWLPISKGYPHSTSAYAKLGRITANQSESDNSVSTPGTFELRVLLKDDPIPYEVFNLTWDKLAEELSNLREHHRSSLTSVYDLPGVESVEITPA